MCHTKCDICVYYPSHPRQLSICNSEPLDILTTSAMKSIYRKAVQERPTTLNSSWSCFWRWGRRANPGYRSYDTYIAHAARCAVDPYSVCPSSGSEAHTNSEPVLHRAACDPGTRKFLHGITLHILSRWGTRPSGFLFPGCKSRWGTLWYFAVVTTHTRTSAHMHVPVPPGNRDSTDATNFAFLAQTRNFLQNPQIPAFFVVFCTLFTCT